MALEAQACGLPLVAFKTGGIPEIIGHKETGYIAGYKDTRDLIEGLKYCLDADLQTMSQKSAQKALANFSLDMMVDKYLGLYASLLTK